MAKFVTKETMVKAKNFSNLVKDAKEKGFELVDGLKYECPACKKEMTKRAALNGRAPLAASFTKAGRFINKARGSKMTACPCGYRRVNIPTAEAAPPSNPLNAAVRGTLEAAKTVKLKMDEKCVAIKNDGERCTYRAIKDGRCGIHQKMTAASPGQYDF